MLAYSLPAALLAPRALTIVRTPTTCLALRAMLHPVLARPVVLRGSLPLRALRRQLVSRCIRVLCIADIRNVYSYPRPPNRRRHHSPRGRRPSKWSLGDLTACKSSSRLGSLVSSLRPERFGRHAVSAGARGRQRRCHQNVASDTRKVSAPEPERVRLDIRPGVPSQSLNGGAQVAPRSDRPTPSSVPFPAGTPSVARTAR